MPDETAQEAIDRLTKLEGAPPTPAQIDELIAALARTDSVTEYIDETPGWSGPPVGHDEVTEVAGVAQRILGLSPAVTLLPVARAYRELPVRSRERVRTFFTDVTLEVWTALPAETRAEIIDVLPLPPSAPDAEASAQCHARLLAHHHLLLDAGRRDTPDAIPRLIGELTSGDFTREMRASEFAARFAPSEPLASALAHVLLRPPSDSVSAWFGSALKATGAKLPKATVVLLAEALEHPRSSSHTWALIGALEPYGKDPTRLEGRARASLVGALARLCLTTPNEGHFSWAIGIVGREDLGRELTPMLAQRLQAKDEGTLEGALRRVEAFGPTVTTLLPRLIELLESPASKRLRYKTLKAILSMGPSAAPAVPALLRVLEGVDPDDTAVSALAAIGLPAAAGVVEKIRQLHTRARRGTRMHVITESALEKLTGQPRS